MKLGMSMACYRWELYPPLKRDSAEYAYRGLPMLYDSSIPISVPPEQAMQWLIRRAGQFGIKALYGDWPALKDAAYRDEIRELLAERGMEWLQAGCLDWVAEGDNAKVELEHLSEQLDLAHKMGSRIVDVTHTGVSRNNHFSKDPPIERQIEIMIDFFPQVAALARKHGLILAMENHLDYRCSEIAQVVEAVDSPHLRVMFDTGNSVGVIEDPVEAARRVAKYTVMVHLKDFRIQAMSVDGVPKIFLAPVGQGQIDLDAILGILQAESPDPDGLPLCLEAISPWEQDSDLWTRQNIRHIREHWTAYLT